MIPNNHPFLLAETAFHHQADITFTKELITHAAETGVDAIKFHLLFNLDDYFIKEHAAYTALKELCINPADWISIHQYTLSAGLKPVYLCNDVQAFEWVNSLPKEETLAAEIHATGINDVFLLEQATKFHGTIILGSGGSTIDELTFAIDFLKNNGKHDILLMHGFQNFPTAYTDINFSRMHMLKQLFDLPVGYADHTDPLDENNAMITCLGVAAGFNVVEKHFTHAFGEKRVDSQAAVSVETLKKIKSLMQIAWHTWGGNPLSVADAEKKYGDTGPMRKAIVAKHPIKSGTKITLQDISYKRTNSSVPFKQKDLNLLLDGVAKTDIETDTPLTFENIQYTFNTGDTSSFFIHKNK